MSRRRQNKALNTTITVCPTWRTTSTECPCEHHCDQCRLTVGDGCCTCCGGNDDRP